MQADIFETHVDVWVSVDIISRSGAVCIRIYGDFWDNEK